MDQLQQQQEQEDLPESIKTYIREFYNRMKINDISEVRYLYYKQWSDLTDTHYSTQEWPSADMIAPYCENDKIFLLCYKELYYRHIFVHGEPHIEHRLESWQNYQELFNMFLENTITTHLILPYEWLNDMIDEFLYQFQDFCQYRFKLQQAINKDEEISIVLTNPNIWKVQTVLNYLQSFVQYSNVNEILKIKSNKNDENIILNVLSSLGYFSLVGLCRIHCLLSDYRLGIKVLDNIDIDDKRSIFTRVKACHITMFYYLGFAYFMMHRYADAIGIFSTILLAHRTSKERATSYADLQMNKYDKILALTTIAITVSPGLRIDEQVKNLVNSKYGDKYNLLITRDETTVSNLFYYACPKFISPAIPNFSKNNNNQQQIVEPVDIQWKWFLNKINQQGNASTIRSFIKLYKTISINKLAQFTNQNQEELIESLILIKNKSYQLQHPQDASSPISGNRSSVQDIHFYIKNNMLHIEESKSIQRYGEYFLNHACKFQQAYNDLKKC